MRKRLGQVFLVDKNILKKIVESAEIKEGEWVLEVGPGKGNLTQFLLEKGANVIGYEADRALVEEIKRRFHLFIGSRLFIKHQDFRRADVEKDLEELGCSIPVKFVSNIPYFITGIIFRHMVKMRKLYSLIIMTLQREVAERMVASPGSPSYGFTTLLVEYYFETRLLFNISPTCFRPIPKVFSSTVMFIPREKPPVSVTDERLFFRIVKESFNSRRKKLRTVLRKILDKKGILLLEERLEGKISLDRRGETLGIEDFAHLTNELNKILQESLPR